MFVAEKGKGAYVHGNPTYVSKEDQLSDSLLATGFPLDSTVNLPLNMAEPQALLPMVRNVRAGGSAPSSCLCGAGRLSGYWEHGLSAWDVAAGALLVQESGGKVTDTEGKPYDLSVRHLAATNGLIHQRFLDTLKDAGEALVR